MRRRALRKRRKSQFTFHGAFKKKSDAARKEKSRKGAFIKSTWIRGRDHRYVVMVPRKARSK